jgi:hypothetical protein
MKKTVFIQSLPHFPTPWGDAKNAWNQWSNFKGLGMWQSGEFTHQISSFSNQRYSILIDTHPTDPYKLILQKHGINANKFGQINFSTEIDMKVCFDYLDQNPSARTVAFGYHLNPEDKIPTGDVFNGSSWFTRKVVETATVGDDKFDDHIQAPLVKLPSEESYHAEGVDESTDSFLIWFFVYRAAELPIYYIIPNPDLMGVATHFEHSRGDVRYRVVDAHFGTIGDLIFRPKFSSDISVMSPNKLFSHKDTFEVYPFEGGIFDWAYKEDVPKVHIKVLTDLKYERDPDTNKLKFTWPDDRKQGFINIRWNSHSVMDLTMSSHDHNFLQNKCQFVYDIYRK